MKKLILGFLILIAQQVTAQEMVEFSFDASTKKMNVRISFKDQIKEQNFNLKMILFENFDIENSKTSKMVVDVNLPYLDYTSINFNRLGGYKVIFYNHADACVKYFNFYYNQIGILPNSELVEIKEKCN